jgi:hypothetical protein
MVRHSSTGQNLLMTGADLLNGDTDTAISQRSEAGRGIMCDKEDTGKYDVLYDVVCKDVISSCMPTWSQ